MPLNPTPQTNTRLEHTLNNIEVARYDDGDGQRVVVLAAYDAENLYGPAFAGDDYSQTAQLVTLYELDELISALTMQRNWLADRPPLDRNWIVIVQGPDPETNETAEIGTYGTYTRAEADAKFEQLQREDDGSILRIAVLQVSRDRD